MNIMQKDPLWRTRQKDLKTALDVLFRHFEGTRVQVAIHEIVVTLDGSVDIYRPDWLIDLEETFEHQYGAAKGGTITKRVLSALMTSGQPVH